MIVCATFVVHVKSIVLHSIHTYIDNYTKAHNLSLPDSQVKRVHPRDGGSKGPAVAIIGAASIGIRAVQNQCTVPGHGESGGSAIGVERYLGPRRL